MHPSRVYEQVAGENSGSSGGDNNSVFTSADRPVNTESQKRFFPSISSAFITSEDFERTLFDSFSCPIINTQDYFES